MTKACFFALPSVSVTRTLNPLLSKMADAGFQIEYYNTAEFINNMELQHKNGMNFRSYPACKDGFDSSKFTSNASYFDLAEMLINTTICIIKEIVERLKEERPDIILHSHLAPWGKLIADHLDIPAVSLYSTFMLDRQIMLPILKKDLNADFNSYNIQRAHRIIRKINSICNSYNIKNVPDIWELYVNREALNISFILECFQPSREKIGSDCLYVGYPEKIHPNYENKTLIYVSMGTVFNKSIHTMNTILDTLEKGKHEALVSLGTTNINLGRNLPSSVTLMGFVDQVSVLKRSRLFISRGGMASVHESIYCMTPLIVIPDIPEQRIIAEKIHELGIGLHLPKSELTVPRLNEAINTILNDWNFYVNNIKNLLNSIPTTSPEGTALYHIEKYLKD